MRTKQQERFMCVHLCRCRCGVVKGKTKEIDLQTSDKKGDCTGKCTNVQWSRASGTESHP